jgi:casein kinase I family protein HRR25
MIVGNKYEIIQKIGEGSFSKIYKAKNNRTKELVAIKIENIESEIKLLLHEAKIYKYLSGCKGMPIVKWFGLENDYYYMVITLLGESLEERRKKQIFSLQEIVSIGKKMIEIIENIHSKGLLHRDIKPDNFLFGQEDKLNELFLIDFGFCKYYLTYGNHIEERKTKHIIGTPNYCSINSHFLIEPSRRDDLESIGYILLYLFNGYLEWSKYDYLIYNKYIYELKRDQIFPLFLKDYFEYIRSLKFEEDPDYILLNNLLIE